MCEMLDTFVKKSRVILKEIRPSECIVVIRVDLRGKQLADKVLKKLVDGEIKKST